MASTAPKSERIELRTSSEAKDLLQRAAATVHKNVSEFLLDAGLSAASEALVERTLFSLNDNEWKAFEAALDAPTQPKPNLKRLLNEPSILE